MSKNKGQNNANDMKSGSMSSSMSGDMNERTSMQAQNKNNKKGSANKTKTSGTQG